MGSAHPHFVILTCITIGTSQPCPIVLTVRLLRFVHGNDWRRTQKRGLGACEVVSAIGVQHVSVMLDFQRRKFSTIPLASSIWFARSSPRMMK